MIGDAKHNIHSFKCSKVSPDLTPACPFIRRVTWPPILVTWPPSTSEKLPPHQRSLPKLVNIYNLYPPWLLINSDCSHVAVVIALALMQLLPGQDMCFTRGEISDFWVTCSNLSIAGHHYHDGACILKLFKQKRFYDPHNWRASMNLHCLFYKAISRR